MAVSRNSTPGEDVCDMCSTVDTHSAYCNPCDANLCPTCWDRQASHRPSARRRGGAIPHEKTDLALSRKIEAALRPRRTEDQEADLHEEDRMTTWFGVTRTLDRIHFGVGDRYDILLADYPQNERMNLYPSLGCFIGSTSKLSSTLGPPNDWLKG